ncbi:MAG: aminotransferase class I/II-fold pyridoxal phosphate-dependent enzyme [Alphaproteobacteria bacterium]|nr:aminotransferase class I/II-fold pyridoxal phosphate-dependent enzyme [Alphaproteobacteria bacterium]
MSKSFSLTGKARSELIQRFSKQKQEPSGDMAAAIAASIPEAFTRFDQFPGYEKLLVPQIAAKRMGVGNPFFKCHEGNAGATTVIGGKTYLNFSSYNYLGLSDHPKVAAAAKAAIDRYGTTVSASRLAAGERPIHRELEEAIAKFYDVEDCVAFVGGHATNVTTIGYLFGAKDLVIHDALIHNSVVEGVRLSGAARRSFPHNDHEALDAILSEIRGQFERVLIVIEGLYSMDGDVPELPKFVDIKRRHKAFLMIDEAHSMGVLGKTGGGIREHFGVEGKNVDIWMGTMSKSLAGCGGYIAGEHALIENLKYASPGFVYSVGLSPMLAAASLTALGLIREEPERVQNLRARATQFFNMCKEHEIDTGTSQGYAVVPVIVKSSLKAVKLSNDLFERGINVQPIIHPAVEERAARLRFIFNATHTEEQINTLVKMLVELG